MYCDWCLNIIEGINNSPDTIIWHPPTALHVKVHQFWAVFAQCYHRCICQSIDFGQLYRVQTKMGNTNYTTSIIQKGILNVFQWLWFEWEQDFLNLIYQTSLPNINLNSIDMLFYVKAAWVRSTLDFSLQNKVFQIRWLTNSVLYQW